MVEINTCSFEHGKKKVLESDMQQEIWTFFSIANLFNGTPNECTRTNTDTLQGLFGCVTN